MMLTTDQITVTFNLLTEEQRQEWRKAQIEEIRSIIGELAKLKIIEKIPDFNALNDVDLIEDLDAYRNQLSTRRKFLNMDEVDENEIVALYCDGGVISMNPSPIGGTWAWCGVNAKGERVIEQSGAFPAPESRPVSNNHTEQIAITKALEAMPDGWSGTVYSDSQIALGRVFKGWRENNLPKNISDRSRAALKRMGAIETVLLQGHPTKADLACGIGKKRNLPVSEHNVWCDKACTKAAKDFLDNLELVVDA